MGHYLIYEGITPFVSRQSSSKLISLYNAFIELFPEEKGQREFSSLSRDQQIKEIMRIINNHGEYKQVDKIKQLIPFKKFTKFWSSKEDLVGYALLVEKNIREKNLLPMYGSVYRVVGDMTRVEIEDYIANAISVCDDIKEIKDFELHTNIYGLQL